MKQLTLFILSSIFLFSACTPPSDSNVGETPPSKAQTNLPQKQKHTPMKTPEVMDFAEFETRIQKDKDNDTLYIYNFWATWCLPCVKEMPYFQQVHEEYADQKVKLIFVSLDFINLLSKKLIPFINKRNITEDVWLLDERNPNSWIDKVSTEWSGSIPATLFRQASADYETFYERSFDYEELKEAVEAALKEIE